MFLLVLPGLLVACVVTHLLTYTSEKYSTSHKVARTHATMQAIKNTVNLMRAKGYKDPIKCEMIIEFAKCEENDLILVKAVNGNIMDEWGNSIYITHNDLSYTFTSYGPNGRSDNNAKDDLVLMLSVSAKFNQK